MQPVIDGWYLLSDEAAGRCALAIAYRLHGLAKIVMAMRQSCS
jgi:hypothetical protein